MIIEPYTFLEVGTKVVVGNRFGRVVKCEIKKSQFGTPINVHTIHFTKQFICKTIHGNKYKNINKILSINYAGINVHNWNI